ncbi:UNVERIFIED_CONTAM: cytoskeletal protein RodZ [Paenibacillus sp. PvR008]
MVRLHLVCTSLKQGKSDLMMKHSHPHQPKKLSYKLVTATALMAISFAAITGCGNSGEAKSTAPITEGAVAPFTDSAVQQTGDNSKSADANKQGSDADQQSLSPADSKDTGKVSEQGSTSAHQSPASSAAPSNSTHSYPASILSVAKQGTLPNLPKGLGLGTGSDLLLELWGKSESGSTGHLRSYAKHHTDIVLDGSDKVTEITSSDPSYKKLVINQVIKELGKPTETNDTSKDIPDTAEASYTIKNASGLDQYLVFSYQTKTQKVNYVRLYFNSMTL